MIVKFEIEDWADWVQFDTLFAELHDAGSCLLTALAEWMRTREIGVRCLECGWQGEQAEAIEEANRTVGAPPIRCPRCKQYGGTANQGFEVVPATFAVDLSDLEAPTCPLCPTGIPSGDGHAEHEGEVCEVVDLDGEPCRCDRHGGWVPEPDYEPDVLDWAEAWRQVAAGEDPAVAAMIDASFMSFDEWRQHHHVDGKGW